MTVPAVLVVDVANVMGSRPDGWWCDRAGAATRLLAALAGVVGTTAEIDGLRFDRVVAVVEGKARAATPPAGLEVVPAPADGDSAIVEVAVLLVGQGLTPLVVTADRGLRARLPAGCRVSGPSRLRTLLDARPQPSPDEGATGV